MASYFPALAAREAERAAFLGPRPEPRPSTLALYEKIYREMQEAAERRLSANARRNQVMNLKERAWLDAGVPGPDFLGSR